MNEKIYVIAGTRQEAEYWIFNKHPTNLALIMSYVCVFSADQLRGIRNPHGVFVGTWRNRPNIMDIMEALMIASTHPSPALGKIYKELKRKTP